MPIKAKQVSPEQAALVAKGFVSRDDRLNRREGGERNYFYTGEVREKERLERELSSSDSNSSFTSSVASGISATVPGKKKSAGGRDGGPTTTSGKTFLTRGGVDIGSDVDSDEEALAEARRKTQEFLFPEKERNYKRPPPQVNQRLVDYEKTKRAAKIRREQEVEEAALLKEQQVQRNDVPAPTQDRGKNPSEGTSVAVEKLTLAVHERGTDRDGVTLREVDVLNSTATTTTTTANNNNNHHHNNEVVEQNQVVTSNSVGSRHGPEEGSGARQGSRPQSRSSGAGNPDFERLLQLFGEDILAERREREEEEARAREEREYAKTARAGPRDSSSAAYKESRDARPRELYHRPANTFSELQDDALHQLYEMWGNEDYDEGAQDRPQFFVATDHLGEAFTMAATKIVSERSTSAPSTLHPSRTAQGTSRVGDRAFSMEEVAALQSAQRNERRAREAGNVTMPPSGGFSADPEVLIADAQAKLDRYLDSVRWLEQLVRDSRFMSGVAQFLQQHHNTFLHHVSESTEHDKNSSSIKSFSHEEYKVFTDFSTRIAKVVFQVLSNKVKDFDEAEFAENLFDTPVGRESVARLGYDVGPMNVVSYPAWRIMLSISNFESFVDWMLDYIREEYNLDNETVSVSGSRGLRALIESTYRYKPLNSTLPQDLVDDDRTDGEGEEGGEAKKAAVKELSPPTRAGGTRAQGTATIKDTGKTERRSLDGGSQNLGPSSSPLANDADLPPCNAGTPSVTGTAVPSALDQRKGSVGISNGTSPVLPPPLPTPPSSAGGSVSSIPAPHTSNTGSYTSSRGTAAMVKKFGKPKKQPRDLPPIGNPMATPLSDRSGKHPSTGSQRFVDGTDLSVAHPSSAPTGAGVPSASKTKTNRLGHAESPRAERSAKRGGSRPTVEAPPRRNASVKKKKTK